MEVNPKLDKYIQNAMLQDRQSRTRDRFGIIAEYNADTNMATVLMSDQFSDQINDVITNVPCPTNIGIQGVAPEPGRGCWVAYDGTSATAPYILSFTNLDYPKYDYMKQSVATTAVPKYMLDLQEN